jgi:putative DNA primase/helicase
MMNNSLLSAMAEAGIAPAAALPLPIHGEIQRFQVVDDKNGSLNGWITSFSNQTNEEVFVFGSWKNSVKHIYSNNRTGRYNYSTREKIDSLMKSAKIAKEELQKQTATNCFNLWEEAIPATSHPYLESKNIKPHIARTYNDNWLLIPVVDAGGHLTSLQSIGSNGRKTFKKDGKIAGCYCPIGYEGQAKIILICEGFATGATLREATNLPVIVAFNAGNLRPVAESIRLENPTSTILICADNDHSNKDKNIGLIKAEQAAQQASGLMIFPSFLANDEGSDFNDFAQLHGNGIIQSIIIEATS